MSNLAQNLAAIKKRYPDFYQMLISDKGKDWVEEIQAENGDANLLIRTNSNPFIASNNNDPKKEADELSCHDYHNDSCTVIIGAGNGYFTRSVLDKMEKRHVVLLVEPIAEILKLAFKHNDFSKEISEGNLLFACTIYDLDYQLSLIENKKSIETWYIPVENYTKHRPDEYNQLIQHTMMMITQLRSNTGTVIGAGNLIAENDIKNLPYIIQRRGVKELEGLYKGKPAILVSTGPSLKKNIHLLIDPEVQKRFIIIAVGQALRILKSYDIKPDFICSVDYGPVNFGHYKGLLDTKDIPLVAINRSYQPIIKHWEGPLLVSTALDGYEEGSLSKFITHKGGLLQGGSVAHMNFGLAVALGCDPIIIIGQDLSYSDGLSHHNLTDEAGKVDISEKGIVWKVDDPRSDIKGEHDMGPTQFVNGYYGNPVPTNFGYVSFISNFERMFRTFPDLEIINATEGGVRLEETTPMTLQEVIEKHTAPIDKSVIEPLLTLADKKEELVDKAIKAVNKDISDLEEIIKESQTALNMLPRMKPTKDKKKLSKSIKTNHEASIKAKQLADRNPLVASSVFWAARQIANKTYSNAKQEIKDRLNEQNKIGIDFFYTDEGKEILKVRCEANKIIMEAARNSAKKLLELYKEALEELQYLFYYGKLKPYESINPEPNLEDAEEFFAKGNWGYPLLESYRYGSLLPFKYENIVKKAIGMKYEDIKKAKENYDRKGKDKIIKFNHYIELAHKEGSSQINNESKDRDFKKAFEYLEKAKEYDPDRPEVKWGFATTYHGLGDIEEAEGNKEKALEYQNKSIQLYKELVEEFPDNHRFKFELALVYMRIGNGTEADKIYSTLFKETDEFDFFLLHLTELYLKAGLKQEALTTIEHYIQKFPLDPEAKKIKEEICF